MLTFLGAWDRTVPAKGYMTGVYSSQDSGIGDMQAAAAAGKPGFTQPDAIWIALWDGRATLDDGTLDWPIGDRAKQYAGNLHGTVGGITAQHRPGRGRRAAGPLIHARRSRGGTSRGPGKPVRAKCRRLISSRHGPTQ